MKNIYILVESIRNHCSFSNRRKSYGLSCLEIGYCRCLQCLLTASYRSLPVEADCLLRYRPHTPGSAACNQDLSKTKSTWEAANEVLALHLFDFLFTDLIWLMIFKFVCMGLLVLGRELTPFIPEAQASFSAFSLHNLCSFRSELLPGFWLICFSSHSNNHTAISPILIEDFCLFSLFLLEVVRVTWIEIVVWVMLELNVSGSVPFCFYCIQWFLLIILLSLSQILWSLLWKPKFKVGTFEI